MPEDRGPPAGGVGPIDIVPDASVGVVDHTGIAAMEGADGGGEPVFDQGDVHERPAAVAGAAAADIHRFHRKAAAEFIGSGRRGDVANQAAEAGGAVERALRAAQNLHPFQAAGVDVDRVEARVYGCGQPDGNVVQHGCHGGIGGAAGGDAAHGEHQGSAAARAQLQSRNLREIILQAERLLFLLNANRLPESGYSCWGL